MGARVQLRLRLHPCCLRKSSQPAGCGRPPPDQQGRKGVSYKQISPKFFLVRPMNVCWLQGWGAFADQDICRGAFVCEYAGELLSNSEADARLAAYDAQREGPGHALLVQYPVQSTSFKPSFICGNRCIIPTIKILSQ